MIPLLRHFLGWLIGAFRSREDLIPENLAVLRQNLAQLWNQSVNQPPTFEPSEENLQETAKMRVEAYVAVSKQKHNQIVPPCPRGPIPKSATLLERMRRKLQTKMGRKIYARRKAIVEPVFGQIKQGRGFRQFLLRGVDKVRGEWALVCMTHNLLKLHRACY